MIKVTIRRNMANPPPGKRVEIDPQHDTFTNLLDKCSLTLGVKGKKLFDSNGHNITMMHEITPNDVYYLTEVRKYTST
jgi:hypothetical protein